MRGSSRPLRAGWATWDGCRRGLVLEVCAILGKFRCSRISKFVIMSEHPPSQQASTIRYRLNIRYRLKYRLISNVNFDKAQPLRNPPFPELWRRIPTVVPLYRNHRDPARLLLVPPRPWGLSSISSHSNVLASSPQSPLPSLVISVTLWCVFIVYQECCR